MGLGHWEILLLFLLVLLIFGGKKIPEVARGLGKGIREFKKAKKDVTDSFNEALEEDEEDEEDEKKKEDTDSKNLDSDYKKIDKKKTSD